MGSHLVLCITRSLYCRRKSGKEDELGAAVKDESGDSRLLTVEFVVVTLTERLSKEALLANDFVTHKLFSYFW